jgi:hypothetical protein
MWSIDDEAKSISTFTKSSATSCIGADAFALQTLGGMRNELWSENGRSRLIVPPTMASASFKSSFVEPDYLPHIGTKPMRRIPSISAQLGVTITTQPITTVSIRVTELRELLAHEATIPLVSQRLSDCCATGCSPPPRAREGRFVPAG